MGSPFRCKTESTLRPICPAVKPPEAIDISKKHQDNRHLHSVNLTCYSSSSMFASVCTRIRNEFFIQDEFDRTHGTETTRHVNKWRLGIGAAAVHYQATRPELFSKACEALPPEVRTYPFFDLGCGKGRVLIMAHEFGFKQIVGVELSQALLKTCRRNLTRLAITNVSLVAQDAAVLTFPDSPVVVFMYNPFRPPLLNVVIERLSMHAYPVFLIYVTPEYREIVERNTKFAVLLDLPDLVIYGQSKRSARSDPLDL
jgi:SAM-dependent methyltransferase